MLSMSHSVFINKVSGGSWLPNLPHRTETMEIDQKQDGGDHPGHRICENDGVNIVVAWYVKKQPQHTEGAYASHG